MIVENELWKNAEVRGLQFEIMLKQHPVISDWRRKGLMIGVELDSEDVTDRLVKHFLEEGLITDRFLFRPNAFRIAPPLTITKKQVEDTAQSILKCLNKL